MTRGVNLIGVPLYRLGQLGILTPVVAVSLQREILFWIIAYVHTNLQP